MPRIFSFVIFGALILIALALPLFLSNCAMGGCALGSLVGGGNSCYANFANYLNLFVNFFPGNAEIFALSFVVFFFLKPLKIYLLVSLLAFLNACNRRYLRLYFGWHLKPFDGLLAAFSAGLIHPKCPVRI